MKLSRLAAATALVLASTASQAVTIFSDNFNADALGLNQTTFLGGWTVSDGTVDLIGTGFFDFVPANIRYVDLDGSTSNPGVFSKALSLTGGQTYTAFFDLAGSHRGSTETVHVTFGSTSMYTLASGDGFGTRSITFTPGASGTFSLSFENMGADNVGVLLDNVVIDHVTTAVPEPETYALMLAGLGLVGFMARRRKG